MQKVVTGLALLIRVERNNPAAHENQIQKKGID